MSIAPGKALTGDDLLAMPDGDQWESNWITGRILMALSVHADKNSAGLVFGDGATYQCFLNDPEMVRKPNVSFIRAGRLPTNQFEHGHCRIAPDLAVEVVSPNELHIDLMRKLEDYFSAGVPLIWVVEPKQRLVTVYEQGGKSIRQVREGEELTAREILPGFRLSRVFPDAACRRPTRGLT
jgi:Uma2 family endonuclease